MNQPLSHTAVLDDLPIAQCKDMMQDSAPARGRKSNKEEATKEQGISSAEDAAPPKATKAAKAAKAIKAKMPATTRLSRCAKLAMLLSSFTSAKTCQASISTSIIVCQDKGDCPGVDPEAIEVNDKVTFQVCVENLSKQTRNQKGITAVLQANTMIEVILACKKGLPGQATCHAGQWPRTFEFLDFTPSATAPNLTYTYTRGVSNPAFLCTDDNLCGELHIPLEVALPYQKTVCFGMITTNATKAPDSGDGTVFQTVYDQNRGAVAINDPVAGLTANGEGSSDAILLMPLPPPSPSSSPPPPSPPLLARRLVEKEEGVACPPQWLPVCLGVHTVQDVHRSQAAVAQSVLLAALAEGLEAGGALSDEAPRGLLNDTFLLHAGDLQPQFTHAEPFPHISIDNFMKHEVAEKLLQDFPPFESANNLDEFGKPGLKAIQPDLRSISPAYAELWKYVCSVEFLEAMSQVTGIRNLLCDPTFFGGGTHENKHGQRLDTHIDYNYARDKRWHRRLNVLFYLNKRWHPEWGGRIELFKDPWVPPQEDAKMHRIMDVGFNRAVIFATSEYSWHGFKKVHLPPDEQAAGTTRKLISLYLYTRNRPPSETAPPHSTQYIPDYPSQATDVIWDRECNLGRSNARCELVSYHSWVRPMLSQYFKGEVEQSSINLRLQAAVVEATLGSRVHGEVKLLSRSAGCGQNLNDPWFETSAWFEVRPRRGHTVHRVDFTINFGNIPDGNRLAGNMVGVQVLEESGHSIRVAGSARVLAERSGTKSFAIPLKNACNRSNLNILNKKCVLTIFFRTPTEGNYIGDDIRSLAFLLDSATFISTASTHRRLQAPGTKIPGN